MNESAVILSLPSELLCMIFLIVREASTSSPESRISQVDCRWTITAVCRHFRAVALGCAQLWAFIDFGLGFGSDTWAIEVLSRSRNIPPCVTIFGGEDVNNWDMSMRPPVKEALVQALDAENLVGLKMHGTLTAELHSIFDWLSQHAMPKLRSLSLGFRWSHINAEDNNVYIYLTSSLFRGIAPALKDVKLDDYVHVSALDGTPALKLDNLTDLCMGGATFGVLRELDTVPALAKIRNLKRLELIQHLMGSDSPVGPSHRAMLTWPHMEELVIDHDVEWATHVLRSVVLPSTTRLSFSLFAESGKAPKKTRSFMRALSESWSALMKPVRKLHVNTKRKNLSAVRVWFDGVDGAPSMDLKVDTKARAASVHNVVKSLNLGQLETLRIIDTVDGVVLQTIMGQSSAALRHIVLPYVMFTNIKSQELPRLMSVHLYSLPTVFDLSKVAEVLERRRADGFPAVRRLVLDDADNILPELLERLEASVDGEVDVNGIQH